MAPKSNQVWIVTVTLVLAGALRPYWRELAERLRDFQFEPNQLVSLVTAVVLFGTMFIYRREIREALGNFRGRGPRPPSHPLPADDALILRRKRRPEISHL